MYFPPVFLSSSFIAKLDSAPSLSRFSNLSLYGHLRVQWSISQYRHLTTFLFKRFISSFSGSSSLFVMNCMKTSSQQTVFAGQLYFRYLQARIKTITTPNFEFNVVFGNKELTFRHYDHKFEWTRSQFAEWCEKVLSRFCLLNYRFRISNCIFRLNSSNGLMVNGLHLVISDYVLFLNVTAILLFQKIDLQSNILQYPFTLIKQTVS
uniref:Small RNA 2'-O-methyltransferase n=1 Tax=Tetranychus urticae TaxID=32264 RepID=T1KRW4_TETUR